LSGSPPSAVALSWPRHQPPVYSPIRVPDLVRAAVATTGAGGERRAAVAEHLRHAYDADSVVLCGSGTQALLLALRAGSARVGGAPVALPAYTCYDVASAAVAAGCRILLYDIDPATLTPDLESVRATLRAGARLVVIAPLYGLPPDWDGVEQCLRCHDALAVEDAAQGHGARWRGRRLGSLAPLSVLSFGRGKGWTAGRGGALLLRDGVVAASPATSGGLASEAAVVVGATAQRVFGRPATYALPSAIPWLGLGETQYKPVSDAAAMTRAGAALLQGSRLASDEEAATRRRWGGYWRETVRQRPGVVPVTTVPDTTPGYLRYPLLLRRGVAGLPDPRLGRRLGIAPGYPMPLSELAPVKQRLHPGGPGLPGAVELARRIVTLPTHSLLRPAEGDQIVALLDGYEP
jgi:perosamine synthetase